MISHSGPGFLVFSQLEITDVGKKEQLCHLLNSHTELDKL